MVEIKKLSEYVWEIPKTGRMTVPVRIFASASMLEKLKEDQSIQQALNMASLPGIYKHAVVMPDAHQGYGFPIGTVIAADPENGIIAPGSVGFDISCGVRLLVSNLSRNEVLPNMQKLVDALFRNVPAGVGSKGEIKVAGEEMDEVLGKGLQWALKKGFATKGDLDRVEENGCLKTANPDKVSKEAKERGKNQCGTLGSGNHFIEVQSVEKIFDKDVAEKFGLTHEGQVCVMIHSGSRGLGHQVCTDYLKIFENDFPDVVAKLPDRELIYAPVKSRQAQDYLGAMSAAGNFAFCNRQLMAHLARQGFKEVFAKAELKTVYEVCHNICKLETHKINGENKPVWVHRKGATRAYGPGHKEVPEALREVGQPVLLPGSMGTSSYVLVGTDKAMDETFGSSAHGSGRVMSRSKAMKLFRGEQLKRDLEKQQIFVKGHSWKGLAEEAPLSYKNPDEVVAVTHSAGIGQIVAKLRPMGVVKG